MNPGEREMLRNCVREIMDDHPGLTHFGFGTYGEVPLRDRAAQFERDRDRMLGDDAIEEFDRAMDWLSLQRRMVRVNHRAPNSYVLKHAAQRHAGGYVSNGMLIAAACYLGFRVERIENNPNAHLSIGVGAVAT